MINDEEPVSGKEYNNFMNESEREPLPVEQAWDNEALVREHRIDPIPEGQSGPGQGEDGQVEDYRIDAQPTVPVPEKIHLCSIDWAAFKQIRTDDIMAYFTGYGPSYVEWLGELSCNVLFQDKYSASRALHNLSQEIPSPPPGNVGDQGTGAADSTNPTETDGADTSMKETPAEGNDEQQQKQQNTDSTTQPPPDLGSMGWRFCKQPIRKVTQDRFGRKGTRARLLLRVANSADILLQRPISKPAPPPGFTTKRVLGPGSDFETRQDRAKKRRRRNNPSAMDEEPYDGTGEHPALSRGLQSGRGGYSVEELEAERAASRQGRTKPGMEEQVPVGTEETNGFGQ